MIVVWVRYLLCGNNGADHGGDDDPHRRRISRGWRVEDLGWILDADCIDGDWATLRRRSSDCCRRRSMMTTTTRRREDRAPTCTARGTTAACLRETAIRTSADGVGPPMARCPRCPVPTMIAAVDDTDAIGTITLFGAGTAAHPFLVSVNPVDGSGRARRGPAREAGGEG